MSVQVTNMAADQQKPSVRDKKKSRKSCLSSLLSSTVMLGNMSSVLSLSVGSKTVILSNEGLSQHQIMGSLQGAVKYCVDYWIIFYRWYRWRRSITKPLLWRRPVPNAWGEQSYISMFLLWQAIERCPRKSWRITILQGMSETLWWDCLSLGVFSQCFA